MSEIKQIADAYGLSYHSVKKWPKSKRNEAIRNLQAGVNPIIDELVGELQRECYVAMCHVQKYILVRVWFQKFRIEIFEDGKSKIFAVGLLNPYELQGAIVKVKELYIHD